MVMVIMVLVTLEKHVVDVYTPSWIDPCPDLQPFLLPEVSSKLSKLSASKFEVDAQVREILILSLLALVGPAGSLTMKVTIRKLGPRAFSLHQLNNHRIQKLRLVCQLARTTTPTECFIFTLLYILVGGASADFFWRAIAA